MNNRNLKSEFESALQTLYTIKEKNAEIEALQKEINRLNSRVEFWQKKIKEKIKTYKEWLSEK